MVHCPKCGKEVSEDDVFCPNCGETLKKTEETVAPRTSAISPGAMVHLNFAFNLSMKKPAIFVPAILGGIISLLISGLTSLWFGAYSWQMWWLYGPNAPGLMALVALSALLGFVGAIISYILFFASLDMSRDAYVDAPLDLGGSVRYVLGRIGTLILASIVGFIMTITIILIPVALLMFVIMVVDETGIGKSISRAFSVVGKTLGSVLIILVVAIVGSIIIGFIPIIGGLLTACLNVVIGLAFIDLYSNYKK